MTVPGPMRNASALLWPTAMLLAGLLTANAAAAADTPASRESVRQQLFERVFGQAVRLDPGLVARVKAAPAGKRLFVDRDGDGRNDEVWFLDDAARHRDKNRPILVRAIDEDGDLDEHRGPDLDSDLYVADWHADGTVDAVLDYQDDDRDGDVDQMAFYFYMPHHPSFGHDVLRVWWGRDDGDDNLLWYDVDYTYYQDLCQYRCHFSGEESFVAFGLLPGGGEWFSAFENPFLFYDPDDDRCSEVVLRIEGRNDEVRAIRWSFDADDDAGGRRTHDYDFSITAYADPAKPLKLPADALERTTLRGLPTQPWLRRDRAGRLVAGSDAWVRALLTWDEINANTEQDPARDPNERWEGVIAHGSEDFKQVGGPPCSTHNKRNELCLTPAPPMRLYYDESDHRLHLAGATKGWLHVDFDLDGRTDAEYAWTDDDGDGRLDRRTLDLDADGRADFDWPMQPASRRDFDLDWTTLKSFYKPLVDTVLADSQAFIDAARAALGTPPPDAAETFFLTKLASWMPRAGLGASVRKTPAGARFYVDLVRDRLMVALKARFGSHASWPRFEAIYASGDYKAAAYLLTHDLTEAQPATGRAFESFTRRIPVRLDNSGSPGRTDWPIAVALRDVRQAAPDFNPDHCAVVAPHRWLDGRPIPHQIDAIEPAAGPEISFLADLPDDDSATYYLYWRPDGAEPPAFSPRTATAQDWVPPNIGWESNRVAYRMYWGQFDFFGKKTDGLIYPSIGQESYHSEVAWGIDALHVGQTCGIGGLWLYTGDVGRRLYNPAGKGDIRFTKRPIVSGPVRAAIEVTAAGLDPDRPGLTARLLCIIYAERSESEIRASLTGSTDPADLAPGLCRLPREKAFVDPAGGCLGAWGFQEPAIDEIGMAVIVPPQQIVATPEDQNERRIRCRTDADGQLRYWIVGDWRRGRQHPVAPTLDNWHREMKALAALLNHPPAVRLEPPEDAR